MIQETKQNPFKRSISHDVCVTTAIDYFYNLHDINCNQKYNKTLPYSFHLEMVLKQAEKFILLCIPDADYLIYRNVAIGCVGHDSIEDARITYNDVVEQFGEEVADIIFLCTEMRGRNRKERKNDVFYNELKTNKLAVFVKLCDILANVTFSLLSNSDMFAKAKEEYPNIKSHLYCTEYKPMFDQLETIFNLR